MKRGAAYAATALLFVLGLDSARAVRYNIYKVQIPRTGESDMENIFGRADRKLGFGCLRLPMRGDEVDREAFSEMVDYFLENGFCYFDTARSYLDGKSETALRECLVERHPRESYIFVDKLTSSCFDSEEEIDPLFQRQLDDCGLEYFDFYLMHAQSAELFEKYKRCRAYEHALEYLKQGRIRHFGISFHDKAEVLEEILRAYPQIELVQLQFNYVDYDDASVQSRKCYELCRKYGKPVVVMEPVKGGCLARLPEPAAKRCLTRSGARAPRAMPCALPRASRAFRWCSPAWATWK